MSSSRATRRRAFLALLLGRWRETYREPEVIIWSFVFPLVLSIGLAIAFRDRPKETVQVAVVPGARADEAVRTLESASGIAVKRLDAVAAAHALRMGHVGLIVVPEQGRVVFRFDPTRPDSLLARSRVDDALQRAAGRADPLSTRDERTTEPGARYIDFLIPGLLAMNLMGGGMWGVGYHLVDMRLKRLLRRLMATPMNRADFMLSQMVLRVAFVFGEVTFLLAFARLVFGVPVRGSLLAIFLVAALGGLCFAGMGIAVASRAATIEKVTGLMNVVQMPMFIASGIFFSAERFPAVVQPFIQALPLTAAVDALRAIILEGASLASQADELAILLAWAVVSFAFGLTRFRWD